MHIPPEALTRDDYTHAERFLPWNLEKLVSWGKITPLWLEGQEQFWYARLGRDGKQFILVDPENKVQRPAFDHQALASSLSIASGKPCTADQLPFDTMEWVAAGEKIRFSAHTKRWEYDLSTHACQALPDEAPPSPTELLSPDKKWAAFVKNYNVVVRRLENGETFPLTRDGKRHFDYANSTECSTMFIMQQQRGFPVPPMAIWSPDSRRLVTQRLDQRKVKELHLLQSAPREGQRPVLHTYRYPMPGDADLVKCQVAILDVEKKETILASIPQHEIDFLGPVELKTLWWSQDGKKVFYLQDFRGHQKLVLWEIDAENGNPRQVLEETSQTYLEAAPLLGTPPNIRLTKDGQELIWYSERDGWANLYRYHAQTGDLLNPITSGPFVVYAITHIDEEHEWVYFMASGHETGRDAYYQHLYRVKLDGSGLQLLTPENAQHAVVFAKSGKFFVDSYSRIDLPPVTVLRACDGSLVLKLEEADISDLQGRGWLAPEPFSVKAGDGVTDLYGAIFRPSHFDPQCTYPVIDSIYPGPQHVRTPKSFLPFDMVPALAELGFIVVTIDGRGNCGRSKAHHDLSYKKFTEAGSLEDHITGLRQLADRYPYMDLSRVGIYGHSGGGFASTKAILKYPDFYKVAVSSAGNHDQRGYLAGWGELYNGLLQGDNFVEQANAHLAGALQGKLLLVHGDMDDNVHPALTLQVVDALIKANKDFDLLILPNRDHASFDDPYLIRKTWDYFVLHLQGMQPPAGYAINAADIPPLRPPF